VEGATTSPRGIGMFTRNASADVDVEQATAWRTAPEVALRPLTSSAL